jgi:hypothetical protein
MPSIFEIDSKIRQITAEHVESRPFLCSGSPIGCAVAEIGINPGTPTPFWPHWSAATGFDKSGWLADYLSRHGKFGPTRRNIDLFAESLYPVRCIELNLYDRFSPRAADLPRDLKRTEVLDYMLEAVQPRLVLVHGDDPANYLSQALGARLTKDCFSSVRYRGIELDVFQAKSHFMKVSKDYVRQLASAFVLRTQAGAERRAD